MNPPLPQTTWNPVTYLFVPGSRPDRFDKAVGAGADAVILDLEDAVAPADKDEARSAIRDWLRRRTSHNIRVMVRINDETTPWFDNDLECIRTAGIDGVVLPKTESASQVAHVVNALPETCFVIPIIESACGILNIDTVASARGVQRLAFGTLDYAVDLDLSGDERGFLYPASRMALASRAAGLAPPVAGVTADINSEEALVSDLTFARACGFGAKLCIHPRQLAAVVRALIPAADEVAWAQRVIAAAKSGAGALQVDGKMVDRPVILKAQAILGRCPGR